MLCSLCIVVHKEISPTQAFSALAYGRSKSISNQLITARAAPAVRKKRLFFRSMSSAAATTVSDIPVVVEDGSTPVFRKGNQVQVMVGLTMRRRRGAKVQSASKQLAEEAVALNVSLSLNPALPCPMLICYHRRIL